jgi:DNA replication protein DnaC
LLTHPTLDRLRELGLDGMAKGFRDLAANPESRALEHAEWLGLLVDQEITLRQQKRFEARTRTARLRQAATVEDVDFRKPRGLDRTLFLHLASCDWVREHRHCLITGACVFRDSSDGRSATRTDGRSDWPMIGLARP